jgi:hypothetical protein
MTIPTKLARAAALAIALLPVAASAVTTSGNPTHLQVGLFKTQLWDGAAWVTVFDAASPTTVDLVTNAGAAFGQGAIDPGSYSKVRFTISNSVAFSADAFGGCVATTGTFPIAASGPTVTLDFATAAQGGGTGWYANGSAANPLLMSAPIDVQADQTTQVTLQFETRDTAVCSGSGSVQIPDAPALTVRSRVVPPSTTFAGGTYWLTHYNAARFAFDQNGLPIDPFNVDSLARATFRMSAGYFLGFGGMGSFSAPDAAGLGTTTLSQGFTENRHQLDESHCSDCGIVTSAGAGAVLPYALGADKTITMVMDKGFIRGAFNEDYTVFIGVANESKGTGQDLLVGVKTGGPATISGVYGFGISATELVYPVSNPTRLERLWATGMLGWLDFDGDGSTTTFSAYNSYTGLNRPWATPGSGSSDFSWEYGTKNQAIAVGLGSVVTLDPDGTGTFAFPTAAWMAVGPGGQVAIAAGDRSLINRSSDPVNEIKYMQTQAVLMKQAPAGTHTVASLAGTWSLAARNDQSKQWNAADTTDFVLFKGAMYGKLVWDLSGTATAEFTNNNDLGKIESLAGAGTISMVPGGACIYGPDESPLAERTAWNASVCPGRRIDLAVVHDTSAGKDVLWLVFSADGRTAAVVAPEGYSGTDPGSFRMLGYLVRAN